MRKASPGTHELARRLVAVEAPGEGSQVEIGIGATRVCQKLRVPLVKLAGIVGFHSLLTRALSIAKADHPSLSAVLVRQDGSLEGLDGSGAVSDETCQSGVEVVAELLGLLVTFIGDPLTLYIVRDCWPNAVVAEMEERS